MQYHDNGGERAIKEQDSGNQPHNGARDRHTGDNKAPSRWELTESGYGLAGQFRAETREQKLAWLAAQQERAPLYPPTQETGTFAGLIGHMTGAGAQIVPYYQTASGIYFCESTNAAEQVKTVRRLDLDQIKRTASAQLYTPDSSLNDVGIPLEPPDHEGTPKSDR